MLVESLKHHGSILRDDLTIVTPNEADFNIWEMPWQHLKTALCDLVTRDQLRKVEGQRTFCGDLQEIDLPILNQTIAELGDKEKRVHQHVATGAFWHEQQLADISESDGKCRHCGQNVCGTDHTLWNCQVINGHRKNTDLCHIKTDTLPPALLNGLPQAMSSCLHGMFWAKSEQVNHDNTGGEVMLGEPKGRMRTSVAQSKSQEVRDLLQDIGVTSADHLNARQAFTLIKQNKADFVVPIPHKCNAAAPEEINVYSDGSWLHPTKVFLGLGGAGVWWPNRSLERNIDGSKFHPLSQEEGALAAAQQFPEGLRLYTGVGGFSGQSTRTELAAGLIAMCAYGPVHIGSDSKAFVDTASAYLRQIAKGSKPRKPWKTVSDGDLWELFWNAAAAKGTRAVRLSWVKGHATQQHVDEGITTAKDRTGNHHADKAADAGNQVHGTQVLRVANLMHERHKHYQKFFKKVVIHITEAYLIHRELTERYDNQDRIERARDPENGKVQYKELQYADVSCRNKVQLSAPLSQFTSYANRNGDAKHLYGYLNSLRIAYADEDLRPITWLEMYILYRCRGGPKPIQDAALKRSTADKHLRAFKAKFRACYKRVLLNSSDYEMFRPHKPTKDALL